MSDVVKIVNAIRPKAKISRMFSKLCDEMSAQHKNFLLHSEVRWLSREKVFQRVFLLRSELYEFLKTRSDASDVIEFLKSRSYFLEMKFGYQNYATWHQSLII